MRDFFRARIPTLIAIVLLLAGGGVGVLLVGQGTGFLPRAGPEFTPQNVTITNVTDTSFSVSWTTDAMAGGFVAYGLSDTELSSTQRDDRDEFSGVVDQYLTHHVTIRGLQPMTTYYFKVGSNEELYDVNGAPYQVSTGTFLGALPPADTIYGQVETAVGVPADGALVYLTLPGAGTLSGLVKESGQWALSLSSGRTADLGAYASYDPEDTVVTLSIYGERVQSRVTVTTQNARPVPVVTLGQDYDFTEGGGSPLSTPVATTGATLDNTVSGFDLSPLGQTVAPSSELTLLNPAEEREPVNTQRPEFYGTGPAGATLTITVNSSDQVTDTVVVGANNQWDWTPPDTLEPGEHTITISFTDTDGFLQTVTRSFVVYAAGESELPAFTTTPSATPQPTPSPTPSPTPTPLPTRSPTPTPIASSSTLPTAGATTPTWFLFIAGGMMLSSGWWLWRRLSL